VPPSCSSALYWERENAPPLFLQLTDVVVVVAVVVVPAVDQHGAVVAGGVAFLAVPPPLPLGGMR